MDPKDIEKLLKTVPSKYRSALLAYLSGSYNPLSTASSGGDLWNQYSGEDTPATIRKYMDMIEQGYNPFQIEAAIDQDTQDANGFVGDSQMQSDTLKNLMTAMRKEKTTAQQSDVFSQMNISSPLEVYTADTVPLPDSQMKKILKLQVGNKPYEEAQSKANFDYQNALLKYKTELGKTTSREGLTKQDLVEYRKNRRSIDPQFSTLVQLRESAQGKNILKRKGLKAAESAPDFAKNYMEYLYGPSKKDASGKYIVGGLRGKEAADWRAAQAGEAEQAIRRGVLAAYEQVGRTPTMDELTAMVKRLS